MDLDWSSASCAESDPEEWHPEVGQNGEAARSVCRECPIQRLCLITSLVLGDGNGVWGGFSAPVRLGLLRAVQSRIGPYQLEPDTPELLHMVDQVLDGDRAPVILRALRKALKSGRANGGAVAPLIFDSKIDAA